MSEVVWGTVSAKAHETVHPVGKGLAPKYSKRNGDRVCTNDERNPLRPDLFHKNRKDSAEQPL